MAADVMYLYGCQIKRVIDGDTVEAIVDLGFNLGQTITVRLFGINTPEVRGPEREDGIRAKEHLINLLSDQNELWIKTVKDRKGKYGRYLGTLIGDGGLNINQRMVEDGFATEIEERL